MAEPGFTAVPIEIPTSQLSRYEKALCNKRELPETAANAKQVAAEILHADVLAQEANERAQAVIPLEPAK